MSRRIFTKEQIETLLQNNNVGACSERSISYCKEFKILAVRKYQGGLPPSEIFRQARFDIHTIGREVPRDCIRSWLKVFRQKGEAGLRIENRGRLGGRPKSMENLNDKEKIKRLEAQVAYLKKENHSLTKLRKKSLN